MMHPLTFSSWNDWILALALLGLGVALLLLAMHTSEVVPAQAARVDARAAATDAPLQQLVNPLPRWWMGLFVAIVSAALLFVGSHPRQAWHVPAALATASALQAQQAQPAGAPAQRRQR